MPNDKVQSEFGFSQLLNQAVDRIGTGTVYHLQHLLYLRCMDGIVKHFLKILKDLKIRLFRYN